MSTFAVGGSIEVDLRGLDDRAAAREVEWITEEPPGTAVTLRVGRRQHPPHIALRYLADFGRHLARVEVRCGDRATGQAWIEAILEAQADSDIWAEAQRRRRERGAR
jgi:hypothetical protein